MPTRSLTLTDASYRFGFNGKEADRDGAWGQKVHYDYGFRIYDPSIARFLSVDPLTKDYPWYTPYQFAGNMPIWAIDLDGLEPYIVTGDSPDEEIKSSVTEQNVPLVTASRTSAARDNTSVSGHNLDAFSEVQSTRSRNPDNFWKFRTGGFTSYSTTNEVYQGARYSNESFANQLLRGSFGEQHAVSFMQYDVTAAMGDFNDKFELGVSILTAPMGLGGGGLISRFTTTLQTGYSRLFFHRFYSVQGGRDAARLLSGGKPWPISPNRAHFGAGLYTWKNVSSATKYKTALSKMGYTDLHIMTIRISKLNYGKLNKFDITKLSDNAANAWLNKHSSLFGKGLPHGYNHIIRKTGLNANEYYFSKDIFPSLKVSKN